MSKYMVSSFEVIWHLKVIVHGRFLTKMQRRPRTFVCLLQDVNRCVRGMYRGFFWVQVRMISFWMNIPVRTHTPPISRGRIYFQCDTLNAGLCGRGLATGHGCILSCIRLREALLCGWRCCCAAALNKSVWGRKLLCWKFDMRSFFFFYSPPSATIDPILWGGVKAAGGGPREKFRNHGVCSSRKHKTQKKQREALKKSSVVNFPHLKQHYVSFTKQWQPCIM